MIDYSQLIAASHRAYIRLKSIN